MDKNKERFILAIDQGTSSSRAILLNEQFEVEKIAQKESTTRHPHPGWVEQDAVEIWFNQLEVITTLLAESNIDASQLAGAGITNQRETTIVWDKSGKPVYPAIIWQDNRTSKECEQLKNSNIADYIQEATGLIINPYFSATKLLWILDNVPQARDKAEQGELFFGTIDSWLVWNLTGGKLHITDYSNASRTMLFNINELKWDSRILKYLKIPASILPEVVSSSEVVGYISRELLGAEIAIAGIAGDQQAALYGQKCCEKGMAKNTYGTGCFLLMNTGEEKINSKRGLLTTIAWEIAGRVTYAVEGSVFMGGAVIKWLRDDLKLMKTAAESEDIAISLSDNEGVYFVPAFGGLGAPYWDAEAKGIICGLNSGCGKAHLVRAALESMAYQSKDVLLCMEKDAGIKLKELHVDGGAAANNFLMQFQSDILQVNVIRPQVIESTALGAGMLAARAVGFGRKTAKDANAKSFTPQLTKDAADKYCQGWQKAVKKSLADSAQ